MDDSSHHTHCISSFLETQIHLLNPDFFSLIIEPGCWKKRKTDEIVSMTHPILTYENMEMLDEDKLLFQV